MLITRLIAIPCDKVTLEVLKKNGSFTDNNGFFHGNVPVSEGDVQFMKKKKTIHKWIVNSMSSIDGSLFDFNADLI